MAYTYVVILKEKIQDVIDSTDWKKFETPLTMEKGIELRVSLIISVEKCNKLLKMIEEDGDKEERKAFEEYNREVGISHRSEPK